MPSIICLCNHRINYGEIPCRDQWLLISDEGFDKFAGEVNAEEIYGAMSPMLKCPNCGRLWVFWDGFDKPAAVYNLVTP